LVDTKLDPTMGKAVAAKLGGMGVQGILVTAAEKGYITELDCAMPECLCPNELGGRSYFEPKSLGLSDWMPTADHFPKLKMDGGHRTVDNVRLAHRLCNRVDYSKLVGRSYSKDRARVEEARREAIRVNLELRARLKVVAWNMNHRSATRNWSLFDESGRLSCDIALLNEATLPATQLKLNVQSNGTTIGRDDVKHGGKKIRQWATAVASPHHLDRLHDVWVLPPGSQDRRSRLMASRPGSWTAAVVSVPGFKPITMISLYGLLDERSDASVHRSLSDLTPLFEDRRYNRLLVLGGDLNTLCTASADSARLARDQGILDRITQGFGLVDLLQEHLRRNDPNRGRLTGCTCSLGDNCRHTWTYRKSRGSAIPYQDDYLFASKALADRLLTCTALPFSAESPSDHAPIVATFR
jgi:exonuclease III